MKASTSTTITATLYIVATPIGNRMDITLRAIETLKTVDYILCEDTRHSKPLLEHFGIKKSLVALHDFNESSKSEKIISDLKAGTNIALISDAGTPLLSDPGYVLVKLARENNIKVSPIPGVSALIAGLSASGVATDTFTFGGFLSNKDTKRVEELKSFTSIKHTLIFYESSHRITKTISDIGKVFPKDTKIVLAKEITKTYEAFISGNYAEILTWLTSDPKHTNGEFVIIIAPREEDAQSADFSYTLAILLEELSLKQAVKITSLLTGHKKNEIYEFAIKNMKS